MSRFTDRMLGQRGVGVAVRGRNRGTVTECPHLGVAEAGVAEASHRCVDGDPAMVVASRRDPGMVRRISQR
jgi:hypothetical protein